MERESMEFDVVIVGAGPAGLSAACRLMQQASSLAEPLTVCVVEKGSEVGAHILSGAVFETTALNALFPDWKEKNAPLHVQVTEDDIYYLRDKQRSHKIPNSLVPRTMHNPGNYIVSMGNVCRWLADQAEALGAEIFPGFPAADILYDDNGAVAGVITGDMGVASDGSHKEGFMPGMELRAKYTLFAEGCRGHLGKQLIEKFSLDKDSQPQHYALGFKEVWDIDPSLHQPGKVIHTTGWPLSDATGGGYLYHAEDNQVFVGLIVDLNYTNPTLSPFDEFQQLKHHPVFKRYLENGKRVSYGARAITKGGFNSLPEMAFPGGMLVGCNAGTLNFSKIKGNHTAMKSGMLAADTLIKQMTQSSQQSLEAEFSQQFKQSWLFNELHSSRNFGAAIHKYGAIWGGAFNTFEQNVLNGNSKFEIADGKADYVSMQSIQECVLHTYPKPDGILSFDKLSSVYLSNTNHEENQPCHLKLSDKLIPINVNLPKFDEPAQRYCPAGVYEIVENGTGKSLQINAQNCIHCKTCDIKDPSQNIQWVTPEGGGGPNYPNM